MSSLSFLIIAGEASGDAHAAALVRALREINPNTELQFFGATGAKMRAEGIESIVDSDGLSILGLWEIGRALPRFWRVYKLLKRAALERKPSAAILVDWPDFNLRLAHWLHRRRIPVIYYVSPQLWAWRSYRVRNMRRDVDLLLSILSFERDWYAARGMTHVDYVGHPFAGDLRPAYDRNEFCRRNNLDAARPIVALLPGSRHKELTRILPLMLDAAGEVSQHRADVQFVLVVAPSRNPLEAEDIIAARRYSAEFKSCLRIIHYETREALAAADAAAVASGTATLEAALLGTPLVVVYKESFVNWHTLGRMITTEHFGLVNLVAGRRLVTELIQNEFTGDSLAKELLALLEPQRNAAVRSELKSVAKKIGETGASHRAAHAIMEAIRDAGPAKRIEKC